MTIGDILDQVAFDASDTGGDYRTAARRWLNIVRSDIADECLWRWAFRAAATITTAAATTSGLYTLVDGTTNYEFVAGDEFYDETNSNTITHESYGQLRAFDQDKSVTGPPTVWADAGSDGNNNRQVYFWPVPGGTYTIRFPGYLRLTDLTETNDVDSNDGFFGPVTPWASTFVAGIRYYHDLNNNEDATQIVLQERRFHKKIRRRKVMNRLSIAAPVRQKILATQVVTSLGRFDPAHFDNR